MLKLKWINQICLFYKLATVFVSNQGNLVAMEKQTEQTANSIKELKTQKTLKYKEMEINIITSCNRFMENLNAWEHQHTIKSPIKGKLQTQN